jgi:hypothetical protein
MTMMIIMTKRSVSYERLITITPNPPPRLRRGGGIVWTERRIGGAGRLPTSVILRLHRGTVKSCGPCGRSDPSASPRPRHEVADEALAPVRGDVDVHLLATPREHQNSTGGRC